MYWRMCYNVKGAKCRKDRKIMAVIYENKVNKWKKKWPELKSEAWNDNKVPIKYPEPLSIMIK